MKLISSEGYGLGTEKYQQNEYIWISNISVNNIIQLLIITHAPNILSNAYP